MKLSIVLTFMLTYLFACSSAENSTVAKSNGKPSELSGSWEVNFIFGQIESLDVLFPVKKPLITFEPKELSISGNTSCNSFSGSYTISGSEIKFSDNLLTTEMLCIDGMDGEKAFLNTLKKVNTFSVSSSGKTLYLKKDGITYMKLRKSAG